MKFNILPGISLYCMASSTFITAYEIHKKTIKSVTYNNLSNKLKSSWQLLGNKNLST